VPLVTVLSHVAAFTTITSPLLGVNEDVTNVDESLDDVVD
jgi:hypothetical protein